MEMWEEARGVRGLFCGDRSMDKAGVLKWNTTTKTTKKKKNKTQNTTPPKRTKTKTTNKKKSGGIKKNKT